VKARLITGSRVWPAKLYDWVWSACHQAEFLVLGDCATGADLWARRFAEFYQRPHRVHVANWNKYRGNAGPNRNTEMVRDLLGTSFALDIEIDAVAFITPWSPCRGTRDCWSKCRKQNIPVIEARAT